MTVADLSNAGVIRGTKVLHDVRAGLDVGQEREQNAGVEALPDPEVDLHKDRSRDDKCLVARLDERSTREVMLVRTIERRADRARVEDQGQPWGSGRSAAVGRAVSVERELPTPRLRGIGRARATCSSSASRTMVAIDTCRSDAISRSRLWSPSGIMSVVRCMTR
ncbi:MAG TPA: hypothetical protein VEF89_31625 [Solirubrobacteraceae bacterium]|nr:hypothetical protein [Solirubrobacteraceae bacterium]